MKINHLKFISLGIILLILQSLDCVNENESEKRILMWRWCMKKNKFILPREVEYLILSYMPYEIYNEKLFTLLIDKKMITPRQIRIVGFPWHWLNNAKKISSPAIKQSIEDELQVRRNNVPRPSRNFPHNIY